MNDADLVRQACNGQSSAYEVLVRRWSARVVGYLRSKVGCPDTAEDIAQDCLLKGLRSLNTLADPAKFGPWLLSMAHRAAIDWLKAKARGEIKFSDSGRREDDLQRTNRTSSVEQPEIQLERLEQQAQLIAEVNRLPDVLREVILLYYYDDVTYKELADTLDVSVATINARLTKARHRLRKQLSERSE